MIHTSRRPLLSDWNAIHRPSGEKNGFTSSEAVCATGFASPDSTSTDQMSAVPERAEKNAMVRPSGDQFAW
jgi:hypothetical protein